ncbi:MAG: hypothetical protein U0165_10775 [Polyangiaceae bacterium]
MRRLVFTLLMVAPIFGVASRAEAAESGDRAEAERLVAELTSQTDAAEVAKNELNQAKRALERAKGARDAKDTLHGEQLEKLARVWAETARDSVRASRTEAEASAIQTQSSDGKAKLARDRVLLEETISRRGRADVELKRVEKEAAERQREPLDREGKKKKPAPKTKADTKTETKPSKGEPSKPGVAPTPPAQGTPGKKP